MFLYLMLQRVMGFFPLNLALISCRTDNLLGFSPAVVILLPPSFTHHSNTGEVCQVMLLCMVGYHWSLVLLLSALAEYLLCFVKSCFLFYKQTSLQQQTKQLVKFCIF